MSDINHVNFMNSFNTTKIDRYNVDYIFEELNNQLIKNNLKVELFIYGGCVMNIVSDNRPATRGIDCLFNVTDDKLFNNILDIVGTKFNLEKDWLNSDIKEPLSYIIKEDILNYKEYSNLRINMCSKRQMLAMKILASRPEPSKDFLDSAILCKSLGITTRNEVIEIFIEFFGNKLLGERQQMFIKYLGEDLGYKW